MEIRHGNQTIIHNDCKLYAVLITNNNITDKWTTKFRGEDKNNLQHGERAIQGPALWSTLSHSSSAVFVI